MSWVWLKLIWMASAAALAVPLLLPAQASAHERRTIASGMHDIVLGWDVEPAYKAQ